MIYLLLTISFWEALNAIATMLFEFCVLSLQIVAKWSGLSYREINVLLFYVVHPLIIAFLIYKIKQRRRPVPIEKEWNL